MRKECVLLLFAVSGVLPLSAHAQVVNGTFDRPGQPWVWETAFGKSGAFSSCANATYTQGGARLGGATESPADGYVAVVSFDYRGDVGGNNLCGRVSQSFVVPVAAKLSFAYKIGDIFQSASTPRTFETGYLYVTIKDLANGTTESLASYSGRNQEQQSCSATQSCPKFRQVSNIDMSKYAGKQVTVTISGYSSNYVTSLGEVQNVPSMVYVDNFFVN